MIAAIPRSQADAFKNNVIKTVGWCRIQPVAQ